MPVHCAELRVATEGRQTVCITDRVAKVVAASPSREGLCNVFVQHTSASLMVCESADPDVRRDLEIFLSELVPDGDPRYLHRAEGPDDMAAHIRSVLTEVSINFPVRNGSLALGVWQGIYLWEHRAAPHRRNILITLSW